MNNMRSMKEILLMSNSEMWQQRIQSHFKLKTETSLFGFMGVLD